MKTRADMENLLDAMPDLSFIDEKLILGSLKLVPQLLRYGIKRLAKKAEEDLPAPPTGRPPIEYQHRAEIVTFIGTLQMKGPSLDICKKRAAQRFGYAIKGLSNEI